MNRYDWAALSVFLCFAEVMVVFAYIAIKKGEKRMNAIRMAPVFICMPILLFTSLIGPIDKKIVVLPLLWVYAAIILMSFYTYLCNGALTLKKETRWDSVRINFPLISGLIAFTLFFLFMMCLDTAIKFRNGTL